jgi:hypothetical protein
VLGSTPVSFHLPDQRCKTDPIPELNCTTPSGRDTNPLHQDYSEKLNIGRKKCWKNESPSDPNGARRRALWINKKGKNDKGCLWLYQDNLCGDKAKDSDPEPAKPDVMNFDPNGECFCPAEERSSALTPPRQIVFMLELRLQ